MAALFWGVAMRIMRYAFGMLLLCCSLNATIRFSSKESAIRLKSGAQFNVQAAIVGWDGNLIRESGSTVTAEAFAFGGGRMTNAENPDSFIEGSFTPTTHYLYGNVIMLADGNSVDIEGTVNDTVFAHGAGNIINGSPKFAHGLILEDGSASLQLGITSVLDCEVRLNSGSLILTNDLTMERPASLIGPGTIYGNGQAISLTGGVWDSDLRFAGVSSIQLQSNIQLRGTWSFYGYNNLIGNGNVIDLSDASAQIHLEAGAVLVLTNIYLKYVEQSKLTLAASTSELHFSNASLILENDVNSEFGKLIVDGSSTFFLGYNDWIFTNLASLKVQDTVLWVDSYDRPDDPIFGSIDSEGGFHAFVNGATVKQVVDQGRVESASVRLLLSGFVTTTIRLDQSVIMNPENAISFVGDSLIIGAGSNITFAGTTSPQIIIPNGVTATFDDISLLHLLSNTIDLQAGGTLEFLRDVIVEMAGDMVFSDGIIQITGGDNVTFFRGTGGHRTLSLIPSDPNNPVYFNLGANTLALEDITLNGLPYITASERFINNTLVIGAIALKGKSVVNVDADTKMNFLIDGTDNEIRLLKNDLHLNGRIMFGTATDNWVRIKFALKEQVDQFRVYFGANSVTLSSPVGRAGIYFPDFDVAVVLTDRTSFSAFARSYLGGERIRIYTNPIKQYSNDFSLESGLELESDLTNPVDADYVREGDRYIPVLPTVSYSLDQVIPAYLRRFPPPPNLTYTPPPDNYFPTAAGRAIKIPKPNLRVKKVLQAAQAKGSLRLEKGGSLASFSPHATIPSILELAGSARVLTRTRRERRAVRPVRASSTQQLSSAQSVTDTFKTTDQIIVSGTDNQVLITGNLSVRCPIVFEEGSELVFKFDDSLDTPKSISFGDPDAPITAAPYGIELPKKASLVFDGAGEVHFITPASFLCQGTPLDEITPDPDGSYDDDRPSIIFKNYAKLILDDATHVEVSGNGIFLMQDYAQANVTDGHLIIGPNTTDYFDFTIDRNAIVSLGRAPEVWAALDIPVTEGRISLPSGIFNINFNRAAQLEARQGGVIEFSLLDSEYKGGDINNFNFNNAALLTLADGGVMAVGQQKLSIPTEIFHWDNTNGLIEGNGFVASYAGTEDGVSTFCAFKRQLQPNYFAANTLDAYEVARRLTTITPSLTIAIDYISDSGAHELFFINEGSTVTLLNGDKVKFDDPTTDVVYIADANNQKIGVRSTGARFTTKIPYP